MNDDYFIEISISKQLLSCYYLDNCVAVYKISSGKNGVGEKQGSGCTPRGWHEIAEIIGLTSAINTVFVGRIATGEIYSNELGLNFPDRDWILTRILWLKGLEPSINLGGVVDTYNRYIYIHGTNDEKNIGKPMSHGCIRMHNHDVMKLASWAKTGTKVFIQ